MSEDQERLLSIGEASRRLGISIFTVRRLIEARDLKAVRVARRLLVAEGEVRRVMADGCGKYAAPEERS